MAHIPYFSTEEIRKIVPMKDAIEAMRMAFSSLSSGDAVVPERLHMDLKNGTALFMHVYIPDTGLYGTKIVSINPGNADRGLPLIHALVVVMDATTGEPKVVLDGSYLTALRTGAASRKVSLSVGLNWGC